MKKFFGEIAQMNQQLAEDEHDSYSNATRILQRDFHVDDLVTGALSFDEALPL